MTEDEFSSQGCFEGLVMKEAASWILYRSNIATSDVATLLCALDLHVWM